MRTFPLLCVIFHINVPRMTDTETLMREIEACADRLGISPSTVGEKAGQGGHFYKRLQQGKRIWPETAAKVRLKIQSFNNSEHTPVNTGATDAR